MNNEIRKMNNLVHKVQKLAKAHLGTPQKLYQTLQTQAIMAMRYGYSSNLMLATGSSGVDINNHFKDIHGIPFTHIDDKRIYKNTWSESEKQLIKLHVPKSDLYVVCDNVPLSALLPGGKNLAVRYRRLNFHDVYLATQRFFKAEHKLNIISPKPTKQNMLKQVAHDDRVGQHGFIKEALDDLTNGQSLNHQTGQVEFSQMLAYKVSNAIVDNPFYQTKQSRYYCYWLPEILIGGHIASQNAIKLNAKKSIHDYKHKLAIIKNFQKQHLTYLVYVFNNKRQIIDVHKVRKSDMKYIIKAINNYLKSN